MITWNEAPSPCSCVLYSWSRAAAGAMAVQPMKYEWLYSHWSCHRELYFEENSQMETVSFIYWCSLLLLEALTWEGKRHWYNEVSACCWLQCHIWHRVNYHLFVSLMFYFNRSEMAVNANTAACGSSILHFLWCMLSVLFYFMSSIKTQY